MIKTKDSHNSVSPAAETLSIEQIVDIILARTPLMPVEEVPLLEGAGRVLAQNIYAVIDMPTHPSSAMDGYAVRASDISGASPVTPCRLKLAGKVAPHNAHTTCLHEGEALRLSTGTPLPKGADCIVRFEDTNMAEDTIEVLYTFPVGSNIRPVGESIAHGALLLPQGRILQTPEIAVLASAGCTKVRTYRKPVVAILPTGDEVAQPGTTLEPGQIYDGNSYGLAVLVNESGGTPIILPPLRDQQANDLKMLGAERQADVVVTSGGIGNCDYDHFRSLIAQGNDVKYYQVRIKPGKAFVFGVLEHHGHAMLYFGMPGNAVSCLMAGEQFLRPALLKMTGKPQAPRPTLMAVMDDYKSNSSKTRTFARVNIHYTDGCWHAKLAGPQGSSIVTSLTRADGLAIIPEEHDAVPGDRLEIILLRQPPIDSCHAPQQNDKGKLTA